MDVARPLEPAPAQRLFEHGFGILEAAGLVQGLAQHGVILAPAGQSGDTPQYRQGGFPFTGLAEKPGQHAIMARIGLDTAGIHLPLHDQGAAIGIVEIGIVFGQPDQFLWLAQQTIGVHHHIDVEGLPAPVHTGQ